MISDGGVVVTGEDWEVNKGLSSRSAIEAMDIPALLERGFHVKLHDCFPAAPSFQPSQSWSSRILRARLTAPEGSEMTRIGMAAVVLRPGAGMALAVTGVLVLLLKICSSE